MAEGDRVPPDYDQMIAKIIAHGQSRDEALDRLSAALGNTVVVGPRVNTPFLKALVDHPAFRAETFDTGFIERHRGELLRIDPPTEARAIEAGIAALLESERKRIAAATQACHMAWSGTGSDAWSNPWAACDGFSLGPPRNLPLDIIVDGAARRAMVFFDTAGARVTMVPMTANGMPGNAANGAGTGAADATFPPLQTFEVAAGIVVVAGRPAVPCRAAALRGG